MTKQRITDADYANALAAGRAEAETEIRALSVRYVPERGAIEIVTTRNGGFLILLQWIGVLQGVSTEGLAGLEPWPDGSAFALEDRDIHTRYPYQRERSPDGYSPGDAACAERRRDLCEPRRQGNVAGEAE